MSIIKKSVLEAKKIKNAIEEDNLLEIKEQLAAKFKEKFGKVVRENVGLQGNENPADAPQPNTPEPSHDLGQDVGDEVPAEDSTASTPVTELTLDELINAFSEVVQDIVGGQNEPGGGEEDLLEPGPQNADQPAVSGQEDDLINLNEDAKLKRRKELAELLEIRNKQKTTQNRPSVRSEKLNEGILRKKRSLRDARPSRKTEQPLLESFERPSRFRRSRRQRQLAENRNYYGIATPQALGGPTKVADNPELLEAKLQYINRTVKDFNLTETQQSQVIKAFNNAKSIDVLQEVYKNVLSGLTAKPDNVENSFTTGIASRPLGKDLSRPNATNALNEERIRLQRQAGIIRD